MKHDVFNSPNFNHLTIEHTKTGLIITGETKEGLEKDDEIQSPINGKVYLPIREILERRDSRDYPAGNNYFYKVLC